MKHHLDSLKCVLKHRYHHQIFNGEKCFISHHVRSAWIVSFGLAIGAVGLLTLTVFLLLTSQYTQANTAEYGRLTGFVASKCSICFLLYKINE